MGQAYFDLYTTARRVLTGSPVNDGDLVAAATALEHLQEDPL